MKEVAEVFFMLAIWYWGYRVGKHEAWTTDISDMVRMYGRPWVDEEENQ